MTTILDMKNRYPKATRAQCALLARLDASPGRYVSYGDLQAAIEAVTGNGWSMDSVRKAASLARVAIGAAGQIECAHGIGYRLNWLDAGSDFHAIPQGVTG